MPVTIVQDTLDELNETFSVVLSSPSNATISDATGIMTITDDEGTPTLSVAHVTTSNENATNLVATVTLSGVSSQTVTVNYATANGTATAGSDYTSTSGTLTFSAGDTSKTVNIPILADTVDEENETFTFTLSSSLNAAISTSSGIGTMTITDDDAAPTISINDVTSAETAGTVNSWQHSLLHQAEQLLLIMQHQMTQQQPDLIILPVLGQLHLLQE